MEGLLLRWQRKQGPSVDYHDLKMLKMTRWNFCRDHTAKHFRVIVEDSHTVCNLSCVERLKVPSKPSKSADDSAGMFSLKGPSKSTSAMFMVSKSAKASATGVHGRRRKEKPFVDDSLSGSESSCSSKHADADHVDSVDEADRQSISEDGDSAAGGESESSFDDDEIRDEPWNAIGLKCWTMRLLVRTRLCHFVVQSHSSRMS